MCRLDVQGIELLHLVDDEWLERRDDESDAVAEGGGQLVAEALAAAGGHEHEDVVGEEGGVDGLELLRAEGEEAEALAELQEHALGVVVGRVEGGRVVRDVGEQPGDLFVLVQRFDGDLCSGRGESIFRGINYFFRRTIFFLHCKK